MMKSIIPLVMALISLVSGGPLFGSPTNATIGNTALVAEDGSAYFDLDPHINNALCSGVYATKISVRYAQTYLAPRCLDFLELIGGLKANTDVDVVIVCKGTEPKGSGDDQYKIKVVVFAGNDRIGNPKNFGPQWVEVRLQATSVEQNKVASTPGMIGFWPNDEGTFRITTLYCR